MSATPDACIACGEPVHTPVEVLNRPGLAALAARVGVHAQFKATMLDALGAVSGLQTRRDDDLSIALLDAFACVCDVLTFYQERIANESYLATATERRSLVELGRLIDYRPRPGVAASVALAFTVENAPGAPQFAAPPVTIGVGAKVQSLPAQGQPPLTVETVEQIVARPEWNAIAPQSTTPQPVAIDMNALLINGLASGLQSGDRVLIVVDPADASQQTVLDVTSVTPQTSAGTTHVQLAADPPEPPPPRPWPIIFTQFPPDLWRLTSRAVSDAVLSQPWRQADLEAFARVQGWDIGRLRRNIKWQVAQRPVTSGAGAFAFRDRAAIFGHNSPASAATALPSGQTLSAEANANLGRAIDLDRVYPGITPGDWVVLQSPTQLPGFSANYLVYQVEDVLELSRADYGLSARVTRLLLSSDDGFDGFTVRGTTAFVRAYALDLADLPLTDPVEGDRFPLDDVYFGLQVGQTVIVSGERADLGGVINSEAMTIATVDFADGRTLLTFSRALSGSYARGSVVINANVALATHGETVSETLGSGDAQTAFLTLPLRQPPLTYVSANTPSGGASTLSVSVSGLTWSEAPNFFGRGPRERIYVTRTDDDGTTKVLFGDGVNGARPSTGPNNIAAVYRKGIGASGNVDAGQLTLMLTRPPGVRGVSNPLAASGGADLEPGLGIRQNAPLAIRTLDRVVSLQDYEDFARAFAGIAKAMATPWLQVGARGVLLTLAGPDGAALDPAGDTLTNLIAAIREAGAPCAPLTALPCRRGYFELAATIVVAPGFPSDPTLAAVEAAMRARFGFDARAFAQPVLLSDALATMQAVPGVVAVEPTRFERIDQRRFDYRRLGAPLPASLPAASPDFDANSAPLAAELLTLDPRPMALTGVVS